jgi:ParB family chromosome partitioning protein
MTDNNQKMGKGLGRGLDALIPGSSRADEPSAQTNNEINIALIDVNPHQPRTDFDEESLKELADSIKKHGVLQPLVVSPLGDHFELIAGERRLRASKIAGLTSVPVIIRDVKDHEKLEIAIIENVQRADLNPVEEALSYRKLMEEFNYTQDQVAESLGKSRSVVANKVRLLTLSAEMKRALRDGQITEGHAKALLAIPDEGKRSVLFDQILGSGLNVRDTEKVAQKINNKKRINISGSGDDIMLRQLADDLKTHLGTKVNIRSVKKGGRIEIDYYSQEELSRIYQKIKGIE